MTQKIKKIAITGGIGSGKSTLLAILKELGYPVFSCDDIYRSVCEEEEYLEELVKAFGTDAVKEGEINKKYLSELVFSDEEKLKRLNELSHPRIMRKLHDEMNKYPVSFAEVPVLFESGRESEFDDVIIVMRNEEERVSSVSARDSLSEEEVRNRVKNQVNYQEKSKMGYTVFWNDGDKDALRQKAVTYLRENNY